MEANLFALIGIVTPLIVAVVASAKWSSQAKGIAALVASVVLGAATAFASGMLNPADILGSVLVAYGAAQAAYTSLFKPLGITAWVLDNLGLSAGE